MPTREGYDASLTPEAAPTAEFRFNFDHAQTPVSAANALKLQVGVHTQAYSATLDSISTSAGLNEAIDDRAAALIQNGTGITWSYNDGAGTLTPTVTITQYTDELAQDAVAGALIDSSTIDFTYNDGTNEITADVKQNSINLSLHVTGTLPVANGGTGLTGAAWTTYTPTVTAASGTFTTVSATGRHQSIGKTVHVEIDILITTNGTAAGHVIATLPALGNSAARFQGIAQDVGATLKACVVRLIDSQAFARFYFYDGTYPGSDAARIVGVMTYEVV